MQFWLKIMGYNPEEIDSVEAIQIPMRMKKEEVAYLLIGCWLQGITRMMIQPHGF